MFERIVTMIDKSFTSADPHSLSSDLGNLDILGLLNTESALTSPEDDPAEVQQLLTVSEKLQTETVESLDVTHLTHLSNVFNTYKEVRNHRRSLDANGMRYLIAMRTFLMYNNIKSSNAQISSADNPTGPRLRYRDMMWALFSESQDLLVQESIAACGGKLTWHIARSLGLFLWLVPHTALVRSHLHHYHLWL